MIYNSAITCKIYNPFLLPAHKNFERIVVDAFVCHKLILQIPWCFGMSFIDQPMKVGVGGETTSPT
jgi:hypothetical protein